MIELPEELTDDYLDYPFLEDFEGPRTLREELETIGEDIEAVKFEIQEDEDGTKKLIDFLAWTGDSVLFLNIGLMNERFIAKVQRNP